MHSKSLIMARPCVTTRKPCSTSPDDAEITLQFLQESSHSTHWPAASISFTTVSYSKPNQWNPNMFPQTKHIRCPASDPPPAPQGQQHWKGVALKASPFFTPDHAEAKSFFRSTRDRSRIETGIDPDLAPAVLASWPSHLVLLSQEESVSLLRHFCLSPSWEGWLTNLVFSALTPARHTADALHRSGAAPRNCFWTTSARHAAEKHLEREHKIHFYVLFWRTPGLSHFPSELWCQLRTLSWEDVEQEWHACAPWGSPGVREAGDRKEAGGTAFGGYTKMIQGPKFTIYLRHLKFCSNLK